MRTGWIVLLGLMLCMPLGQTQQEEDLRQHWAYQAIEQLQRLGILEGYPDGSFRPNRPLTRAEFAQAVSRAYRAIDERLRNLQRRVETLVTPEPPALPTDEPRQRRIQRLEEAVQELRTLQEAVQTLERLMQAVRTERDTRIEQIRMLKEELQALQRRFEQLTARFSWRGDLTFGGYSTHSFDGRSAFTLNGNPINPSGRFLRSNAFVQELALTVEGRANERVSGRATFIIGNYLSYLRSPARNADSFHSAPDPFVLQSNTDFALWEAYIKTELPLFGRQVDVLLGRLPLRFTRYTLQRIDPDIYLDVPRYDDGAFRVDGVLFGTGGNRYRLNLFLASTHRRRSAVAQALQIFFANHNASVSAPADQIIGLRTEYKAVRGEENFVNIGLTLFAAGIGRGNTFRHLTNPTQPADRVDVLGLDVSGRWSNIRFGLEYAQSIVYEGDNRRVSRNNTASDAYAEYDFSERLGGRLGYREIQPFFIAPGNWGRIGYLYNPSDIKGSYLNLRYKASDRLNASITAEFYTGTARLRLPRRGYFSSDKLNHYQLDVSYQINPRWQLNVSYENVVWRIRSLVFGGARGRPEWNYLTLQLSYNLGENTALNILYQFIDANGKGVPQLSGGPGATGNRAGVAATTLRVQF